MTQNTQEPSESAEHAQASTPGGEAERKAPRWRRWLIDLVLVVAIIGGVRWWQQRGVIEGEAPALRAAGITGEPLQLAGASEATLVHFWASWCGVCKAMDHNVVGVAEDRRVITVAVQSGGPAEVAAFMREEGLWQGERPAFDVVADPSGALAGQWGVTSFPTSFVVDPDGRIRSTEVGYTTELGLRARLSLAD